MERWEPDFDFYMAELEDLPASFVVDLNAAHQAPVASHPLLLTIEVPMLRPLENGLRDASELDDLGALEDQFVEALATKVDAMFVGRTVHGGATTFYSYVPDQHRDALDDLPVLTGAPPDGYEPSWGVDADPGWEQYTEFLAPDEYAHQSIWNRRLVRQFTDMGDALELPRELDHLAYFPTREAAAQAATALTAAGFRCDDITSSEDAEDPEDIEVAHREDAEVAEVERFGLQFHRDDALADGRPDEVVGEILDIILPLEGAYDGWGAAHVKAGAASA